MPTSKSQRGGKSNGKSKSAAKSSSRSSGTARSDIVSILKEDHAKVKGLLERLSETTPRGAKTRQDLLFQIQVELEKHAAAEEELVYPAFLEIVAKDERKLFFEAREEHALVRRVLEEIGETPPESEEFAARAKVLKDLVEHHAEEEEAEMLPMMKKEMERERLVELGEEFQSRKEELEPELEERFQAAHAAS